MSKTRHSEPSSFRDPSGHIFTENQTLYRQINQSFKDNYRLLRDSGLFDYLVDKNFLLPHQETKIKPPKDAFLIIQPQKIPFISYPYEWCFSQLQAAALLTLDIQLIALKFGLSLKDASAYNIQFLGTSPIFIDTLSFEKYPDNEPWVAYRQYCQHFLAPLVLMAYTDLHLNLNLRLHIDGLSLGLTTKLLPLKARLNPGLFAHLYLHARSQHHFSDKAPGTNRHLAKKHLINLIQSLRNTTAALKLPQSQTEWADYYDHTNYSKRSFSYKKKLVSNFLAKTKSTTVLDLGANTGVFSQLAADQGAHTISVDIDPLAVEKNFGNFHSPLILPIVQDITNPSPAIGWRNQERQSFLYRLKTHQTTLALALIHHLAISNNLPLPEIAKFFSSFSTFLIIEFIPKEDSQVQRLLSTRVDIFPDYRQPAFEKTFARYFQLLLREPITGSHRILYLMKRK